MELPVPQPLPPMEATTSEELPSGPGWLYEPKWDGFRCIVLRDGSEVELQSKACKSLTRYFPELVAAVRSLAPRRFALDGEIVVPEDGDLSFDQLLQRIHPAETRVRRLSQETPARIIVFDLLATGARTSLLERPLEERRPRLEEWARRYLKPAALHLSPATAERPIAEEWLRTLTGVDGVVAKRIAEPYRTGERAGMTKVKRLRTADCVVGGFRHYAGGTGVGSLLLGLYDEQGLLNHVGFCSAFSDAERRELLERLEPLVEAPGFTGNAPGAPSRWNRGRSQEWEPLRPELVVEIEYDHFSSGRFRHGTRLLRWRPDKPSRQCTYAQLAREGRGALRLVDPA